jgi:hypothetical protein
MAAGEEAAQEQSITNMELFTVKVAPLLAAQSASSGALVALSHQLTQGTSNG